MTPVSNSQSGQAMIEAVLSLVALIGLLFAIQLTGQIRSDSIDLLGKSSYQSFLQTLKKFQPMSLRKDLSGKNSDLETKFSQQLLYVFEEGLIRTKSDQDHSRYVDLPAYQSMSPLRLSRTSYLFINAGQSESASEVQQRIERSKDAWMSGTKPTRVLLSSVKEPLRRTDAPWRRAPLTTDWLMKWAGQIPAVGEQGRLR